MQETSGVATEIEIVEEAGGRSDPAYQDYVFDPATGRHRNFVGGHWDEMGEKQVAFLREQGLAPRHLFLDVGCGSLRAGRLISSYLDPGNYYGIDINHSLLVAGYDHELDDEGRARLPSAQLRATDRFNADFGVKFDYAIAQSVFTHVSLNWIRLCLWRVSQVLAPGGKFYATFFRRPDDFPIDGIGRTGKRFTERNAYWYYRSDIRWAASRCPLEFRYLGRWGHPAGSRMVEFTRRPDPRPTGWL
ncbi:MAG: class I SAM-dependent methyltransferase [Nocardioides sp.]